MSAKIKDELVSVASGNMEVAPRIIKEEVHKHAHALRLRARMNTLIPIACIPPEMLVYIFSLFSEIQHYAGQSIYRRITITHVCHHWRELALNCPSLWSHIALYNKTNPECAMEFIRRTQKVPLHLRAEELGTSWIPILKLVFQEYPRIHSLTLVLSSKVIRAVVKNLPTHAPALRTLVLCPDLDGRSSESARHLLPFSPNKLGMTSLQEMTIHWYRVKWSRDIFPSSLTRLRICYTYDHGFGPFTYSDIVDALSVLPLLEHLTLEYIFPPLFQVQTARLPAKRITMPHPRELVFKTRSYAHIPAFDPAASTLDHVYFLDYFKFVAPVQIRYFFGVLLPNMALSLMAPPLTSALNQSVKGDDSDNQAVTEFYLYQDLLAFIKKNSICSRREDRFRLPSDADLQLYWPVASISTSTILSSLCTSLPLYYVSHFSLVDVSIGFVAVLEWKKLLKCMPNVQNIGIGCDLKPPRCRDINILLGLCDDSLGGRNRRQYVMPNLKEIYLRDVIFGGMRDWPDLYDVLQDRDIHGSKVQRVTLESCFNVTEADVRSLREYVFVIWDGLVQDVDLDSTYILSGF